LHSLKKKEQNKQKIIIIVNFDDVTPYCKAYIKKIFEIQMFL